ncbi:MAG: NAD(+)--rifampin ADP-ribosyltransferase [Ilumatobacter sp.]|nr:NAD(+)--rifampin ADP-ribosyltransferase [Ilumatobacter sp.]
MAEQFLHGTRADLRPGDHVTTGHVANFGERHTTTNVYFTATLDAAIWGAELAVGDGPGRIYVVEPTGPYEDDPNLTDTKYRGNPTKSYRSKSPLLVTGEITDWEGHGPERVQAMKDRIAGLAPIDD